MRGIEEAIIKNYEITLKVDFECPHCGHLQKLETNVSAYSSVAEDPTDDMCEKCEEFVTIQL